MTIEKANEILLSINSQPITRKVNFQKMIEIAEAVFVIERQKDLQIKKGQENEPCEFCKRADFGFFSAKVDKHLATIYLGCGSGRFEKNEQFKFCPECGKRLT